MKKKIKVLHLVGGPLTAGAFKGSLLLHKSLKDLGISSNILNNYSPHDIKHLSEEDVKNIIFIDKNFFHKILNKFFVFLEKMFNAIFLKTPRSTFSLGLFGFDVTKLKEYNEADLIHIHWLNQGFLNLKSLSKIISSETFSGVLLAISFSL